MAFEYYIQSGTKRLRCGFTTGTCATLAALGAARLLLSGERVEEESLLTPKGLVVSTPLEDLRYVDAQTVCCAVRKDAGDDADVTDGLLIYATLCRSAGGIVIEGGAGVGRVTKPGLDQNPGAAAINSGPRAMLCTALTGLCKELGYWGGLEVRLSVPRGAEIAKRTFNESLGIEGGISILGTSGIVEPMSEAALLETIALQLRQARALGATRVILTPGNFAQAFLQTQDLEAPSVKCANFIGESLDLAGELGFASVLLVGHIGKLVKLAGGILNTHSRYGDCRRELFCAHAALCGADATLARALMDCVTSEALLAVLEKAGLRQRVQESLFAEIQKQLTRRAAGRFAVGAILFSTDYGLLGETTGVRTIKGDR